MGKVQKGKSGDASGFTGAGIGGLPTEIWILVGEKIRSKKTLWQLVKTCVVFREIFTPFVHCSQVLQLEQHDPSGSKRNFSPPPEVQKMLPYVKDFRVGIFEYSEGSVSYHKGLNKKYAFDIAYMIKGMRMLESFWWCDQAVEDYSLASIVTSDNVVSALTAAPRLKHLRIAFSSHYMDDPTAALSCFLRIQEFQNLTSLELYHFYSEPEALPEKIAGALSRSPNLRRLGLGLACDADCDTLPEAYILEEAYKPLLQHICLAYKSNGSSPLALDTLRLGHGLSIFKSTDSEGGNYLANLCNLSALKTLHLFNGIVMDEWREDDYYLDIYWEYLEDCSSLHQLSVWRLGEEVAEWMNKYAKNIKELIIIYSEAISEEQIRNLCSLNHQLSSLFAWDDFRTHVAKVEDEWADTDSSSTSSPSTTDVDMTDISDGDETMLSDSEDSEKSSTLSEANDENIRSFHDYLHSNKKISKIALSIDLKPEWQRFSALLPELTNLTHLYLTRPSEMYGIWPRQESSLWPGVNKPADIAYHFAQAIKERSSSLQYIRIDDWVWQCITDYDLKKRKSSIRLMPMEWEEVIALDFFMSLDTINVESGLPAKDLHPPYLMEKDLARVGMVRY